jgi:hypothetical protein
MLHFDPTLEISPNVLLQPSWLMSLTATNAPSSANLRAVALPISPAAPVTSATLSFKRLKPSFFSGYYKENKIITKQSLPIWRSLCYVFLR